MTYRSHAELWRAPLRVTSWHSVLALVLATSGCASGRSDDDQAPENAVDAPGPERIDAASAPDAVPACETCAACVGTPWGTVQHGFTGTTYQSASPAGACTSQTRTCTDGTLSGTYLETTCAAGCVGTPWGDVPSGFSETAFQRPVAIYGTTCATTTQVRTCVEGSLSGTYANASCINYPCGWGGGMLPHEDAAFEAATFPSVFHECALDGTWGPALSGNPVALGTPCELEGRWFEHSTCGYYQGITYRCQAGTWIDAPACPPGP